MLELTKEYKEKGFFVVSPIFYKERTFLKCGNNKNKNIYYFEIKDNKIFEIKDEEILKWLTENYNYKSSPIVY